MKKLIVTAIGAAAAFGAFADPISTQRFKDVAEGEKTVSQLNDAATPAATGTGYWFDAGEAASNNTYTVTNTADSLSCPLPFGEQPERVLDITTDFGTPLGVNIKDGGTTQNIGTGFYFDSLVKFTVCDDDQSVDYNTAKIALWLQENADPEDDTIVTTNIMVKAGYLYSDGLGGLTASGVVYKCQSVLPSFAESWHRVTIKVLPNITDGGADVPGFVVYIDGSNSTYDERPNCSAAKWDDGVVTLTRAATTYGNALFPSMDQSGTKSTLTAVEYAGTGSLTDLKFTDVAPAEFAEDPVFETAPATITVNGEDVPAFDNLAQLMAAVNNAGAGTNVVITFAADTELTAPMVFTTAANVTLDFKGFIITNTQEFAAITNDGSNLTIKDSSLEGTGGIYCKLLMEEVAATYAFVAKEESGSETTIEGGIFRGLINYNDSTATVSGGAYVDESFDGHLAAGKTVEERDGLLYVVDKPTTYTITVAGGEHMTIAVTTNDVPAGAAGGYVLNAGDKIAVTYTAETGYTLSKYSDSIASVSAEATIAAPVATLLTYKVIFVDGDAATTNIVNYGDGVGVVPSFVGKTGYTAAWDSDPAEVASVTSDLTFTAIYTIIEYSVTYNLDLAGATNATANISTFTIETPEFTLLDAGCEGYTFNGWTNAQGNAVSTIAGGETGAVEVYASWSGSGTYPVPAEAELNDKGEITVPPGTTSISIGGYTIANGEGITIVGTTATVLPAEVEEGTEKKAVDVDDDYVTLNVDMKPGLFYGVKKVTSLETPFTRPTTLTQFTGKNADAILTVPKGDDDAAFFKVYVDIKE